MALRMHCAGCIWPVTVIRQDLVRSCVHTLQWRQKSSRGCKYRHSLATQSASANWARNALCALESASCTKQVTLARQLFDRLWPSAVGLVYPVLIFVRIQHCACLLTYVTAREILTCFKTQDNGQRSRLQRSAPGRQSYCSRLAV